MRIVIAFVVGVIVARGLVFALADVLASPVLQRENYRGRRLPTAAGLVLVFTVLAVEGARAALGALGVGDDTVPAARIRVLVAVVGFGLLGLLDDLLGNGDARGFRGHVGALVHARVTTGFCKLAGGAALALVLASVAHDGSGFETFVDAALIALAANLANLLDRVPGRAIKAALVAYVPVLILCGTDATGVATAVVLGAALALLPDDLRERLMLGDTGANVVGAVLGLAVVIEAGTGTRLVVAAVLFAVNVLSEFVSFSTVIRRVPPLRRFDELGRGNL
ncbi:MAG: hypothetical protein ABWZ15_01695 [Acidimicrobiia bacterium]